MSASNAAASAATPAAMAVKPSKPTIILMVGMAGSGKSTLLQRIRAELSMRKKSGYAINLDPAVSTVPYACNIDIRDTVNYKKVMQQYELGPNGAIVTSLNLFSTRFDQVINILKERSTGSEPLDYVLVDTPGQIEVFAWSASGTVITNMLSEFRCVIVFVVDTHRVLAPTTFMANMLYACSVLYKAQLPFVLAFNKTDIADDSGPRQWMVDLEAFQTAMDGEGERTGYIASLMRSLGWALDSFYDSIPTVSVSAATGKGMDELFAAVDEALEEDERQAAVARAGEEGEHEDGEEVQSASHGNGLAGRAWASDSASGDAGKEELAALRAAVMREALPPQ